MVALLGIVRYGITFIRMHEYTNIQTWVSFCTFCITWKMVCTLSNVTCLLTLIQPAHGFEQGWRQGVCLGGQNGGRGGGGGLWHIFSDFRKIPEWDRGIMTDRWADKQKKKIIIIITIENH